MSWSSCNRHVTLESVIGFVSDSCVNLVADLKCHPVTKCPAQFRLKQVCNFVLNLNLNFIIFYCIARGKGENENKFSSFFFLFFFLPPAEQILSPWLSPLQPSFSLSLLLVRADGQEGGADVLRPFPAGVFWGERESWCAGPMLASLSFYPQLLCSLHFTVYVYTYIQCTSNGMV